MKRSGIDTSSAIATGTMMYVTEDSDIRPITALPVLDLILGPRILSDKALSLTKC